MFGWSWLSQVTGMFISLMNWGSSFYFVSLALFLKSVALGLIIERCARNTFKRVMQKCPALEHFTKVNNSYMQSTIPMQ